MRQKVVGVGVAVRTDYVVNAKAMFIDPISVECVMRDCGHWLQERKARPQSIPTDRWVACSTRVLPE